MAVDKHLVAEWIQYLKSTQIAVADKQNPGKLKYRKPVTAQVLAHFLSTASNFTPKQINAAIEQALGGKANNPGNVQDGPPGIPHDPNSVDDANYRDVPPPRPGATSVANPNPAPMPPQAQPALRGSRYNNQDAEDADYKEVPRTPKAIGQNQPEEKPTKPHYKMTRDANGKPVYKRLREDFEDNPGPTLDEKDVERVFEILMGQQTPDVSDQEPAAKEKSPEEKQKDLNKFKSIIRDRMSAQQRKAFWRLLNDDGSNNLTEEQLNNADIKSILKTAAKNRENPGFGRSIPGFRKDKVNVGDLQKAWADAGYPDDTRDISAILKKQFGFSDREIEKVYSGVFGDYDKGEELPSATPALQNLADYAKENGLTDDVIAFMKQEFGEELGLTKQNFFQKHFGKKAVAEEVRQIFTEIVSEQREDRFTLIRQQEQTQLGRSKK